MNFVRDFNKIQLILDLGWKNGFTRVQNNEEKEMNQYVHKRQVTFKSPYNTMWYLLKLNPN